MSLPTIAEVREVLERAPHHRGCPMHPQTTAVTQQFMCLCGRDDILARLDPEMQVIADRDSLAAALNRTKWWEHAVPGPLSVWTNPELADAVLAALRARP